MLKFAIVGFGGLAKAHFGNIEKVKEALKGTDTEAIKAASEGLTQKFYQISEKMYQQANPGGAQGFDPSQAQQGAPDGEDVYDANYREVDDNN